MATQLNPYLTFNGNCREAMNFYKEVLGGDLSLMVVGESPIADQCPTAMQDQIMHSELRNNGLTLMGTDMTGPEGIQKGNDMTLSLNFDSEEEINRSFKRLSEGGKVLDELSVKFWGGLFGMVQDQFGKVWMFNYQKDQSQNG